jgi:hypothetical protein
VSFELEPLVIKLGEEFKRRGMTRHLEMLRRYFASRRRRLRENEARPAKAREFDEQLVIDWLGLIQIPPFEHLYDVLPPGAPCPCGARDSHGKAGSFAGVAFPGGRVWTCLACRRSWLVQHEEEIPGGRQR